MASVLVLGATGLVGRELVRLACADSRITRVVAPTRRPLTERPRAGGEKLENRVIDFDALPDDPGLWQVDAVLCALGTTLRKAGSKDAMRRIDHDLVVNCGERARRHGVKIFGLVSSVGASPRGMTFYLRLKAEVEAAVTQLGFESLTIARPAGLGGERDESRPLERIGLGLIKALGPLVPRGMKVIPAERVANALLEAALEPHAGCRILESRDLW
jgi:uncharacterized protein YbjT (DUF2867 family)